LNEVILAPIKCRVKQNLIGDLWGGGTFTVFRFR